MFIWLINPGYSPSLRGSQGITATVKAGKISAQILAGLLSSSFLLSHTVQDSLPRDNATHNGLGIGLSTSINNHDSPPQANLI